ncbi:MAG: hypothetical protein HYT93_03660 [Parcubacteria group bacterium]|nr:hypothetical protein [Parcubacteria group bacterium]
MAIYFVAGRVQAKENNTEVEFPWSGVVDFGQPIVFDKDIENLTGVILKRISAQEGNEIYDVQNILFTALSQLDVAKFLEKETNRRFYYWVLVNMTNDIEGSDDEVVAYETGTILSLDKPIISEESLAEAETKIKEQCGADGTMIMNIEFLLAGF